VFEGDVLRSEIEVEAKHPLASGGGLVDLRVRVFPERAADSPPAAGDGAVLDWRAIALMA
jgi:acyl dehydratase